jgi:GrpB-like predicted nucleotidyltransferase (UPF0157 family)
MESQNERVQKAIREEITIVPYDPVWPEMFESEKKVLLSLFTDDLVKRIEHFGSTAVPGLSAKPVIDMLVEVASLKETKKVIVPVLIPMGYEYFWRPTWGDDVPPFYAWFIKRNESGKRTHHIHMVEKNFEHWDRLLFRDYLIEHPYIAKEYESLKQRISADFTGDRAGYTNAKTQFILKITAAAKEYYLNKSRRVF